MSTTPVLDLSQPIAERAQVRLRTPEHPDGEIFELRGELELGLKTIAEIQTLFQKAAEIEEGGFKDEAAAEQMERWLNECFDLIFYRPVSVEARAMLPDLRKMQVVQFFLDACLTPASEQATQAPKNGARKKSTGAK